MEAFSACWPKQLPGAWAGVLWRKSCCLSGKWSSKMWFLVPFPAWLWKSGAVLLLHPLCSHCLLKGKSSLGSCCRLSSSRESQYPQEPGFTFIWYGSDMWERISYPIAVGTEPSRRFGSISYEKVFWWEIAIHLTSTHVLDAICGRQPLTNRCLKKGRVTFL